MLAITGACGFIGSNLVHYLASQGHKDIICIDNLSIGSSLANIIDQPVKFHKIDICNYEELLAVFKRYPITQVVHLACQSHVDRSITGDAPFWETNVAGTANILRVCRKNNIEKVVCFITDEYYGERYPENPAVEGDPPHATSPYPCSKVGQYWVCRAYYTTWNTPVIPVFPVNCFGPRQYREKIIPKFISRLLKNKQVPLMESTHFQRDWLPVIDTCRAVELLLNKGIPGEDYNIGANNHCTNQELTENLLSLTGKDRSLIKIIPDRLAHDSCYAVNYEKITQLGYESSVTFSEWLKHTVDWYTIQSKKKSF